MALSKSQRERVRQLLMDGISHRKIAESVGVSRGTVTNISNSIVLGGPRETREQIGERIRQRAASRLGSGRGPLVDDDGDRRSIADLEAFGLTMRSISLLEEELGLIWADELAVATEIELRSGRLVGNAMIAEIRAALTNCLAGRVVKSPARCMVFCDGKGGGRDGRR